MLVYLIKLKVNYLFGLNLSLQCCINTYMYMYVHILNVVNHSAIDAVSSGIHSPLNSAGNLVFNMIYFLVDTGV